MKQEGALGLMKITVPPPPQVPDPGLEATYIIFKDGDRILAKNGDTERIEFTDTDISNLLQNVINTLNAKYGGGRIFIKRGTYHPTRTINIPDGINLVVEGEGNNTVFRYTDRFYLFYHEPSSPTWTSIVALRNFKVDRSGSGSNNTDILRVSYARLALFENIEIVDELRTFGGNDAGIVGFNNIVAVATRNRVYNKDYGTWLFGYLTVLRENYAENTYTEGIAGGGFNRTYSLPSGYDAGGIAIIEDNVCIDCGQGEIAFSIDFESFNPLAEALAIIRNNLVYGRTQPFEGGISVVQASHVIIENNKILGATKDHSIRIEKPGQVKYVVIRNNVVDVQYPLLRGYPGVKINAEQAIVEGNRISIRSTVNSNIGLVLIVVARHAVIRGNYIYATTPPGYHVMPVTLAPFDTSTFDVIFEDNYVDIPSPGGDAVVSIYINVSEQPSLINIVIRKNYFRSPNGGDMILVSSRAYRNFLVHKLVAYDNVVDNVLYRVKVRHDLYSATGFRVTAYVDTDAELYIDQGGIAYYYKRNSGVATIPAGQARVRVSHGLRQAPSKVLITPLGSPPGKIWVENIGSTNFDIVTDTAPTANLNVAWQAEV
jgi:hypothetical protein